MTDDGRNRTGTQADRAPTDAELRERRDRFSRSLDAERAERDSKLGLDREHSGSGNGYGVAFRIASEFVAGVLVGAAIGWGVDRFFGTAPWGLVVFLLLGFVAGVLNVLRVAGEMTTSSSGTKKKERGVGD